MFKESSRTFEGRVRNRSRFGRRRSVPSTSLTATSLNNLTTLLLTQATTWQQSRTSNTSNETALDPEHSDRRRRSAFPREDGGRASAWLKRRRPDAGSRDIRRCRIAPPPFWIVRFATARR
jgi:hypothetical protein